MIGIIAAMDIEIEAIAKIAQIHSKKMIAQCEIQEGTLKGKDIVIAKSGIGKTHAAMVTSILCMSYPIEAVINIGTAGGLLQEENVLDIVISNQVVQADFDTSPIDGKDGIGLVYPVQKEMVDKCQEVASKLGIPYHIGTIASQDLFMSRPEDYEKLLKNFPHSICSEMEAGAVAQVCCDFEIPYVIVRGLSDVVCHQGNEMEFGEYAAKASSQSAKLIEAFINVL